MSFKKNFNPFRNKRKNTWKTGEKFDPEADSDEEATPWVEMKQQLLNNQSSSWRKAQPSNDVLKKRDQEHMKYLITEKPKGETKWEKFTDDEEDTKDPQNEKKALNKTKKGKVSKKYKTLKERFDEDKKLDLTTYERNKIKKVITASTINVKKATFGGMLNDYQHRGVKRFIQK
ncbi:hypothetical protein ACFFRR_004709 [Megaselia abdita]